MRGHACCDAFIVGFHVTNCLHYDTAICQSKSILRATHSKTQPERRRDLRECRGVSAVPRVTEITIRSC